MNPFSQPPQRRDDMTTDSIHEETGYVEKPLPPLSKLAEGISTVLFWDFYAQALIVHEARRINPDLSNLDDICYIPRSGGVSVIDEEAYRNRKDPSHVKYIVSGYTTIEGVRYFLAFPDDASQHPYFDRQKDARNKRIQERIDALCSSNQAPAKHHSQSDEPLAA